MYEIPAGEDKFTLETSKPFGTEKIIVFASTSELGRIDVTKTGGLYEVRTKGVEIGERTRGIEIKRKTLEGEEKPVPGEFVEVEAEVRSTP